VIGLDSISPLFGPDETCNTPKLNRWFKQQSNITNSVKPPFKVSMKSRFNSDTYCCIGIIETKHEMRESIV
jgi:hypothetical protein